MSSGPATLQPTFTGHVATTHDALILFEACLTGQLSHVPRRPHDRERNTLIRSGCVFIYEENASGIKRWTDGVTWSPSRILGNFLVYRELDKPFPPGEKKKAKTKGNRPRPCRPGEPYARPSSNNGTYSPTPQSAGSLSGDRAPDERERSLIGSLVDSYGFKADGLVKKTMSVTVQGVTHHLVSYYTVSDVISGHLRTPAQTEILDYVRPRPELTSKQSFRSPLEDGEDLEGVRDQSLGTQSRYGYGPPPVSRPEYMAHSGLYYGHCIYGTGSNHSSIAADYPPSSSAIAGSYIPVPMSSSQPGQRASNVPQSHMGPSAGSPVAMQNQPHISPYSHSNPQNRIVPVPGSGSVESKAETRQNHSSFSLPGYAGRPYASVDGGRSVPPSPIIKAEPRETGQNTKLGLVGGPYNHERPHIYTNPRPTPLGHGAYPSSAPWSAQPQSQPQCEPRSRLDIQHGRSNANAAW